MVKKPRIYDLARALTIDEHDEKVRKQKQSDIQKQIMAACDSLGHKVKSASSSLDEELLEQITKILNKQGFKLELIALNKTIQEVMANKTLKGSAEEEETKAAAEKPKKQLRIVRRIKPSQINEEPPEPQEGITISTPASISMVRPETTILPPKDTEPKKIEKSKIEKPREKFVHKQYNPPPTPIEDRKPSRKQKEDKKDKSSQPFRVARPSISPSMMGRTKRPSKKRGASTTTSRDKDKERKTDADVEKPSIVEIYGNLTVKELAERMQLPDTEVIKSLFNAGTIRTVNQVVEVEAAIQCAKSLEYEIITTKEKSSQTLKYDISKELEGTLEPRPPVVTIMGHVDHGKTTLLDAIREAKFNVTDSEKGGITQHIGAYQIEITDYDSNKRKITFLDTPGHEAFSLIRARGAQLTDIAILVVAADDGVMPQTIEAIDHAKSAGVPIIVALNKIDKEGIQIDRILGELADHDLLVEDYGGSVVCSKISAKKRENLDDLLTKITLVADAELSDKLRSNPNKIGQGVVIEAERSKERGAIAHVLVQSGTLKKGDCIVAGTVAGRIRAMFDDHGKEITAAGPSTPVEILGLPDVPHAGDLFEAKATYQEAKKIAETKHTNEKEQRRSLGLVEFAAQVREGKAQELKIIIKADAHGSAEAVAKEISKLSTKDVIVNSIHIGSGNISESDVNLAASSNAIIIGFHVEPDLNAQKAIADLGVDARLYDIIYKITEDLEKAILGLLEPDRKEVKVGTVEVRQIFSFGKGSKIAGCYVTEGKIQRNELAKVYRNGQVVYEGKIDNLKRFKDDAKEVQTNFECGISFDGYNDVQEKDLIECWTIVETARTSI